MTTMNPWIPGLLDPPRICASTRQSVNLSSGATPRGRPQVRGKNDGLGIIQKRVVIKCCKMRIKKSCWTRVWDALGSKLSQLGQIDWADWLVLLFAVLPDLCPGWWIVRFTLGLPWFHHPLNFRGKCVPQLETRTYVQSNWVSPKTSLEDEDNTTQSGEEIS